MKTVLRQAIISIILLVIISLSYGQKTSPHIDTSKYAILKFDKSNNWLFKNARATNLTKAEIEVLDLVLLKCIADHNPDQRIMFDKISKEHPEYNLKLNDFIIDISRYSRQYVPVINSKGQKLVWVNCSCSKWDRQWKKEIIIVNDGGNCYFNVIINLATKTYYQLMVNGDA